MRQLYRGGGIVIERFNIHDRLYIAQCQRRLTTAIITMVAGVMLIVLLEILLIFFIGSAAAPLVTSLTWAAQCSQFSLIIPAFAIVAYTIILAVRLIENQALSLLVVVACLHPLTAIAIAYIFCRRLRDDWRRHGINATWRGVSRDELDKLADVNFCRRCGYNLEGNVSGVCPECGNSIGAAAS